MQKTSVDLLLLAALALFATLTAKVASADHLFEGTEWETAAQVAGVPPELLYSVALVETRKKSSDGLARPWPWTLTTAEGHKFYNSKAEAEEDLLEYISQGNARIAVGLMQVFYAYHSHRVESPLELLDPTTNLRIGAEILRDSIKRSNDLEIGIGNYNAKDPVKARAYGRQVIDLAKNLNNYFHAPEGSASTNDVIGRKNGLQQQASR